MKKNFPILSAFLVIWFGLIFISPLFGIHVHHLMQSDQKEITVIHSYYESDHVTSNLPEDSDAQSLFEHISPYGITSDLGDWDGGLVFDISLLFLLFIITVLAYSIINISSTKILELFRTFSPRTYFSRKSYLYFCLFSHLPPPLSYN